MLSVVCPIFNEEKYIGKCIDSILEQDFPKEKLEVLFVDGMSADGTRKIVGEYSKEHPWIRLIDNPRRIVPCAMNLGIAAAKGEYIIRLDAHATYARNYFSELVSSLIRLNADNVGCVCRTDVLNKTPKTLAIREVLSHRFGVGNSAFRTGISHEQEADTVPFGCWRKEVFKKYGMYDVRLIRNQDIELNKRILRGGGKIYLVPGTYCTYLARETYKALAKNNFGNGKWNILTVFYTKNLRSLSIRHFVPLLFLLSLLLPLLGMFLWFPLVYIGIASLCCYLLAIGSICIRLSRQKNLHFFYLAGSFATLHLSYGWGSLIGLLHLPYLYASKK